MVLAGGNVHVPETCIVRNCTIRAAGTVPVTARTSVKNSDIKEKDPKALDLVKFFEPVQAGVEADKAEGGMRVTRVTADGPFAKADVRPGDLITAVGGQPAAEPEAFRRLLRRGVAEGTTVVRIRRGDEIRDVRVRFPE